MQIILHRIAGVGDGFQLVKGDYAGRCPQDAGNAVYNGGTGMLHRRRLGNAKGDIRLAGDFPIAQVPVLGAVYLADAFLSRSFASASP